MLSLCQLRNLRYWKGLSTRSIGKASLDFLLFGLLGIVYGFLFTYRAISYPIRHFDKSSFKKELPVVLSSLLVSFTIGITLYYSWVLFPTILIGLFLYYISLPTLT